jgi:hypothetical protein
VPGTGRDFNLKQNMFKDERRGVLASTDAALTYLQRLYTMFGDWQLALAAYNWGEGNVQKAIQKNRAAGKPTDFESLAELMPAETRNYVPKLQAVKNIIANPAQYNVTLPAIDNQPYFTPSTRPRDIDLAVAAQLAEMSIDEFKALNPQFKRPVITGDDRPRSCCRKKNAEKFHLNLAQWGQALSSWTTHKITGAKETHRLAGLEIRHHAGSHPPGQQHPAADAPESRLDHPGAPANPPKAISWPIATTRQTSPVRSRWSRRACRAMPPKPSRAAKTTTKASPAPARLGGNEAVAAIKGCSRG